MAKIVKRKVNKRIVPGSKADASLEINTPYPKEEKERQKKSEMDHWGEKMVKLQDRVNEIELSLNDMNAKLKQVTGRMGL